VSSATYLVSHFIACASCRTGSLCARGRKLDQYATFGRVEAERKQEYAADTCPYCGETVFNDEWSEHEKACWGIADALVAD
jgi:hypothetical protein